MFDDVGIGIDVGSWFVFIYFGLFGFVVMLCGIFCELFIIVMCYFVLIIMYVDIMLFEIVDDCLVELDVSYLLVDVCGFFIECDIVGIIVMIMSFVFLLVVKYVD